MAEPEVARGQDSIKDRSRGSRLSTNRAKEAAREKLVKYALGQSQDKVREYVQCSKAAGWKVVFQCRDKNSEMNKCLTQYTSQLADYAEATREEYSRTGEITLKPPGPRRFSTKDIWN